MPKVLRDKLMDVPAVSLFKAITDFESYPKFLPEVVAAKLGDVPSANRQRVLFELEIVKRFQYTLEFEITGQETIAWKLVESNFFKNNEGLWRLKPRDGKHTEVHYELDVGFGFLVPGWISKKLTEVNLPKMFDSFEARARALTK